MLYFRKFLVAKNFWITRLEGDYLNFSSKIFCLTVPNHFEDEPFCAVFQKFSGREKLYGKEGAGRSIDNFRRISFVSKCRKVS